MKEEEGENVIIATPARRVDSARIDISVVRFRLSALTTTAAAAAAHDAVLGIAFCHIVPCAASPSQLIARRARPPRNPCVHLYCHRERDLLSSTAIYSREAATRGGVLGARPAGHRLLPEPVRRNQGSREAARRVSRRGGLRGPLGGRTQQTFEPRIGHKPLMRYPSNNPHRRLPLTPEKL